MSRRKTLLMSRTNSMSGKDSSKLLQGSLSISVHGSVPFHQEYPKYPTTLKTFSAQCQTAPVTP